MSNLKKFKDNLYCAPGVGQKGDKTCYSKNNLHLIAKKYNEHNPKQKIRLTQDKHGLLKDLRSKLDKNCKSDWCWLNSDFLTKSNKKKLEKKFRPEYPKSWKKNKNEWLSNIDIEKVMKPQEEKFEDFKFMGVVASDCPDGYMCELSNKNFSEYPSKNITKNGIIFNLDKHYQPGSHWVAVYIDQSNPKEYNVEYYDSYAQKPPENIYSFLENVHNDIKKNNKKKKVNFIYNDRRHQFKNSECGMFSIYYLLNRLEGKSMNTITKEKPTDDEMNNLRKLLYRPS